MIPEGHLSSRPVISPIIGGRSGNITIEQDFENGPRYLGDTTYGLFDSVWQAFKTSQGVDIGSATTENFLAYENPRVKELSFTFDQNGRYSICMIINDRCILYWYDPTIEAFTTIDLGKDYITPKLFLDDKRESQSGNSDILIFYIKYNRLCYVQQRDRFLTEYVLVNPISGEIIKVGMSRNLRVQIQIK